MLHEQNGYPDDLDAIEANALDCAKSSKDPAEVAQSLEIAKAVGEMRKLRSEVEKIKLDVKENFPQFNLGKIKYLAAKIVPYIPLFAVLLTVLFQAFTWQADKEVQRAANEQSQWRDAVKNISTKDPGTTLVSALAMHSFFNSTPYKMQAGNIAAILLPQVQNTEGFDTILFDMVDLVDPSEQGRTIHGQVIGISKMVFNSQLDLYKVNVGAQHLVLDFPVLRQILGEDEPPDFIRKRVASRERALANSWMLSSTSDALHKLWIDKHVVPEGTDLGGVVLVGSDFQGFDFSHFNLAGGAFYKAYFKEAKFVGVDLSRRLISNVRLDGADLSGVEAFIDSKWEHTNWWEAKCISLHLLAYLEKNDATATSENKAAARKISCH